MRQFNKKEMGIYWDAIWASRGINETSKICHPNTPAWYNQFFAHFQKFNFLRLLKYCGGIQGKSALDIGCGTGRWCRILNAKGAIVTGIDIQPEAIKRSKKLTPSCKFKVMPADKLRFKDKSFDIVTSVTVIQHIPYQNQRKVLDEIVRVAKRGGYILLIENTKDIAEHVFPKPHKEWIAEFEKRGCKLVKEYGEGFAPLLRLINGVIRLLNPSTNRKNSSKNKPRKNNIARKIYFALKFPIVLISYPLEYLCDFVLPKSFATHGAFLFRRG